MTPPMIEAETVLIDALGLASIWLVAGLALGGILARRRPAQAHAFVAAGLFGATMAPALSAATRLFGWGLLGPSPVAAQTEGGTLPAGPWGNGAMFDTTMTGAELLLLAWGLLSALLFVRLVLSAIRAARLAGAAMPLAEGFQRAARDVAARMGLDEAPLICRSAQIRSPVIWCWGRRPRVLLPVAGPTRSEAQLQSVLCHEFAHLLRRDHLAALLAEFAVCLIPWHPLTWLAARHRRSLSERACDARVLAAGAPPASYAKTLLALATCPQPRVGLAAVSTRSGLRSRIIWILESRAGRERPGRFSPTTALAAVLAMAVSAFAHHGSPAENDESIIAGVSLSVPPPVAEGRSGIVIAPAELDFGEVAPNEVARGFVWLLNATTVQRRVTKARPDCGCTTVPGFAPTTLNPGESLKLEITMKAPALRGSQKTRNVTFEIEGQPPLRLPVSLRTGPA